MDDVLWSPAADALSATAMGRWMAAHGAGDYADAWTSSVQDLPAFWDSIWSWCGVIGDRRAAGPVIEGSMPDAVWFPGTSLNYAENALARGGALVSVSQTRGVERVSAASLVDLVARAAAGLRSLGVERGDRVVAYVPNITEAVIGMLATAAIGAIWSSCPPEFGVRGVLNRFTQIEPAVLLAVDGYRHRGGVVDRSAEVASLRSALPSLRATVSIPYLGSGSVPDAVPWSTLLSAPATPSYDRLPFAHPLYILYSSGTTGLPKPIVHGHGGILLEHLKMLTLHHDLRAGDRFFWFSTTGWMMWNYLVSGLAVGADIVLFDGDPGYPSLDVLWELAASEGITHFGTSAPFLLACRKAGLSVGKLPALREIGSTGAPLPPDGFRWVYEHVKDDVILGSMSGGTDVCTAFVGSNPVLPVVAGEITCRCLGAAVDAVGEDGSSLVGSQGELVLRMPMPSMPVGLWGDTDRSRFRDAYFSKYEGLWCHGDWITITERGSCVITGRSDSTLNRGGVRMGTSEFYAVVDAMPEIADSLVVHLEASNELLLFVQLSDGRVLDDSLRERINGALRGNLSPRHVPDRIIAVPAVPRTLSGKRLEIPVKRILSGVPADAAASKDALADPAALGFFADFAATRP